MKNLLLKSTVLVAVLFLSAKISAQSSVEVRDPAAGNAVVTGQTFYFWIATGTTHSIDFDAYNVGSNSLTYKIEKQEMVMNATASAWFCVFHNGDAADLQSHCYGSQTTTAPDNFVTPVGDFNRLQCDFSSNTIGLSIVHYRIFDMNNPTDSAGFTLVYYATPAGVPSVTNNEGISNAFPNPSNGVFNFTVESASSTNAIQLNVFNLNGEIVSSEQVNVQNGTVSTDLSALPNGVYFCRFNSGDMIYSERRIVIAK